MNANQKRVTGKRRRKTFILAVDGDNPERELEFEVDFQLSLKPEERYERMIQLVTIGMDMKRLRDGYRKDPAFVIRP